MNDFHRPYYEHEQDEEQEPDTIYDTLEEFAYTYCPSTETFLRDARDFSTPDYIEAWQVHFRDVRYARVIDLDATIQHIKDTAYTRFLVEYAPSVQRTIHRVKTFKEELMMTAWRPRRMEHILDTYGWEVYDNLLGIE